MAISLTVYRDFVKFEATGQPSVVLQCASVATKVTAGLAGAGTLTVWVGNPSPNVNPDANFTLTSTLTDCQNAEAALIEWQCFRDYTAFGYLQYWDAVDFQDGNSPPVIACQKLTFPKT